MRGELGLAEDALTSRIEARDAAEEMWRRLVGLVYKAAGLDPESGAARITSLLREAAGIASAWAAHAPPSPVVGEMVARFSSWALDVMNGVEEALSGGRVGEAREKAELLAEAFKSTHRLLSSEVARYRLGFQIPVVVVAVMIAVASMLGLPRGVWGLAASIIGSSLILAGAAATSISPRLATVSLLAGGAAVLVSLPSLETASIVVAGMVASGLAYLGLSSRHVALILPTPSKTPVPSIELSDEEVEERLREKYRSIYGDRWESMMEYDISVLMRAGFTRSEAMRRRLRELEG